VDRASKPPRRARNSFLIGIGTLLVWCLSFAAFGVLTEGNVPALSGENGELAGYLYFFGAVPILSILIFIATLIGLILGIQALRKKDPQRGLAIVGILINFMFFAPACAFTVVTIGALIEVGPDFFR